MTEREFEEQLREQFVTTVLDRTPGEPPYEAIRRQARADRRRSTTALSASLAVLTVLSAVGVLAVRGHEDARPAALSATPGAAPQPPMSAAQLADGITFAQAATVLGQCLEHERQMQAEWQSQAPTATRSTQGTQKSPPRTDYGDIADYRVLLAVKHTGDDRSPGGGISVAAVSQGAHPTRIICHQSDGKISGLQSGPADPRAGGPQSLVNPDYNGGELYRQATPNGRPWTLPYRWGSIGTFDPSVTRVTVSYGDGPTVDAALDRGWFVATGVLDRTATRAPHVRGYDGAGSLVYDSDDDKGYDKAL